MKKKKEAVLGKDISNRTVMIVLVLVIIISIISLGIYFFGIQEKNSFDDTSAKYTSTSAEEGSHVSITIVKPLNNASIDSIKG